METITHPINTIYLATEGEGIHIGQAQVFVRYQGCAIGCVNCDSMDTWSFDGAEVLTTSQILQKIQQEAPHLKRVSITGGDPLHPKLAPKVLELCKVLKDYQYWINIEAAGTRCDGPLFELVD